MNVLISLLFSVSALGQMSIPTSGNLSDLAKKDFVKFASQIAVSHLEEIPVQHNGRIKPLDTYAREQLLFLTGSRSPMGLNPLQFYLGLPTFEGNSILEFIEVRNKDLREKLGGQKSKRFFSLQQLDSAGIETMARPLLAKNEENKRSLSPYEKDVVETFHQYVVGRQIVSGDHFLASIDFTILNPDIHGDPSSARTLEAGKQVLRAIASQQFSALSILGTELRSQAQAQPLPQLFVRYKDKMGLEVFYNHMRPFLWAGALYFILALCLLFGVFKSISDKVVGLIFGIPLLIHILGFATRVYITGFAPVTSMYGTMLWVAFGVALFNILLLVIYRNRNLAALLFLGSSLVLLLTENFPLILSPDMDPVVAVLRSNYWLTLHVLTVTISYAAFTVCMLIGNFALIKTILGRATPEFYKTYAHYAYRMAQLGVCLITAGIILGGIWADYSWGRFWGWDPKETWALIADMGFIVILHARFVGWLRNFGVLAAAPVAYLLVIMAWYGVNFVLAAGLHSYGFSSGGATFVALFVSLQFIILAAALVVHQKGTLTPKT